MADVKSEWRRVDAAEFQTQCCLLYSVLNSPLLHYGRKTVLKIPAQLLTSVCS